VPILGDFLQATYRPPVCFYATCLSSASLPAQHTMCTADYDALRKILLSHSLGWLHEMHDDTASSASWTAMPLQQQQSGLKRCLPAASRASNMQSYLSDTATMATAVQSKRFRYREQQQEEDEEEQESMACGVTLVGSPDQ
jgi:hypothetical protein